MSKHFEMTDETRVYAGRTLHRIRATRDLPQHGVHEGDLGGWVQSLGNILDAAWAADESVVMDNARMSGNARVWDNARMGDNTRMGGNTRMWNNALMWDNAYMCGDASMWGNAYMCGDAIMSGNARMSGDSRMGVDGEATSSLHIFTATIRTSHQMGATLNRTRGGGHVLHIGCESGTLDHHQALCDSDTWIETTGADLIEARPEYQALIDLCRARVARWNTEKENAS